MRDLTGLESRKKVTSRGNKIFTSLRVQIIALQATPKLPESFISDGNSIIDERSN